uniref:Retrovirus-related Pol polyprotein from transposon TNT 1-94 n=1 Tax=Tanacetum cinerariifolium TaxID=118510 RepID=A0A6L2MFG1_TANCI|nr:hypothetical protein [Tanacetum cinerariifolium]GEZ48628.1 hypothetical protein [Tanacetum cinerariifolium]
MAMLTMRARRKCRALRNQDTKHKDNTRRSVPVETPASTVLVSCDGLGRYDWSDQVKEGPNYAIMAYVSLNSDSNVSDDSTCLKSCLEYVKHLKSQNEQLLSDLKKSKLIVLGYKTCLQSVEERLKIFKKNKFIYLEDIKVLKVKIKMNDIATKDLRRKLEVAQKEKRWNSTYFPPPYTGNFMPPKPDLSYTSLDEFAVKPVVKNKSSEEETKAVKKDTDAPIIEELVSDDEEKNVT